MTNRTKMIIAGVAAFGLVLFLRQPPSTAQVMEQLVREPVRFQFDSFNITAEGRARLAEFSQLWKVHPASLRVVGHTDDKGTPEYNLSLSQQRAQAVADHLVRLGISRSNIVEIVGAGANEPESTNDTEEGRALNRRADITMV